MIHGKATPEGTRAYAERFASTAPEHYRKAAGLTVSSIGIGTYLGDPTDAVDRGYAESIALAASLGCNVIDSAGNYRFQRSERAVARGLETAIAGGVRREEVVVCTKAGFITYDTDYPGAPAQWAKENLIAPGIVSAEDIVGGAHVMTPAYLRHGIGQSLGNLNLDCIDMFYIHNPETQLSEVPEMEFYARLCRAFTALEEEVAAGRIQYYGTATWNGYLTAPGQEDGYMSLERVVATARKVGGEGHHMRFIQLPINLAMPEAIAVPNQFVEGNAFTVLDAAAALGVAVIASGSMLQARLARGLPHTLDEVFPGAESDAQRAIQFVRSAPGVATALVGMSNPEHVRHNLALAATPPMPGDEFAQLIEAGG
jgi:aryl-alcohol dehydrogenase-like predicted oxidoreductase